VVLRLLVLLAACATTQPEPLSNRGGHPPDAAPDASDFLGEYDCETFFYVTPGGVYISFGGCWWVH